MVNLLQPWLLGSMNCKEIQQQGEGLLGKMLLQFLLDSPPEAVEGLMLFLTLRKGPLLLIFKN